MVYFGVVGVGVGRDGIRLYSRYAAKYAREVPR
jgi:hypothetical protein